MGATTSSLGRPGIDSPMDHGLFVEDDERVILNTSLDRLREVMSRGDEPVSLERAGPRRRIFFDPSKLKAAVVTCGGLCPGLNNVIRSLVLTLVHSYGVHDIIGIRYGLQGFIPRYGHPAMELTEASVSEIHELGGTILASSRGRQSPSEIVDSLDRMNVGLLFMIGGDGTLRAAGTIVDEMDGRNEQIGVVVIPKTIDNDINMVSRSFGFYTAVSMASQAIGSAHVEALGAPNGVGLVKLMGRYSGFVAASAALAKKHANYVLIPESRFDMDGPHGLLEALEKRLDKKKHAVIVVAEGAGQEYCGGTAKDDSGNPKLGDVGLYLKRRIIDHFKSKRREMNLKYIDPSYLIRSVPPTAEDAVFCGFLAQNAVHSGMAGKTRLLIGLVNDEFVNIPVTRSVAQRKQVDPDGTLWRGVLEVTRQPSFRPPET